jgi:hypothetical protein
VRLIQRAGRVDRIGQRNPEILCYSFLPEDGIEKIINLRGKLSARIRQNAEVVGSDELFFEGDPVNIADLYNEKAGIFDEEEDAEVDLGSHAYQIWKNAVDARPELQDIIERLPNVVYSTKRNDTGRSGSSAIVYAQTDGEGDALAWVDEDGKIVTQSQYAILKAAACDYNTPPVQRLALHHELTAQCVALLQAQASAAAGALGRKNSTRSRVFHRLERFVSENDGTLFMPPGLRAAMDAIFNNPLREAAADTLSRQLRADISDFDLAHLADTMHREQRLCVPRAQDERRAPPKIICSLGLNGGQD